VLLLARDRHDARTLRFQHFGTETEAADLDALEVIKRLELAPRHGGAPLVGIDGAEEMRAMLREGLSHDIQQAGLVPQIVVVIESFEGTRNAPRPQREWDLAAPVGLRAITDLDDALADGIEHFERRHECARRECLDLDPTVRHFIDALDVARKER